MQPIEALKDNRLNDIDRAIIGEIVPFIDGVSDRFEKNIDMSLISFLARRMATRQYPLSDLAETVEKHYKHQEAFLSNKRH